MVIQLNKIFQTKDTRLAQYVKRIHKMLVHFEYFSIHQIPRKNNAQADFLAKLARSSEVKIIPVGFQPNPSIGEEKKLGKEALVLIRSQVRLQSNNEKKYPRE